MNVYQPTAANSDVTMPAVREMCHNETERLDVVRDVLERVGDKWSVLILGMLEKGPVRFTALQREIPGISQRMLSHTLRALQRDGLVSRQSFNESPPRVEYTVTELGHTLLPAVILLAQWAWDNRDVIEANHTAWDDALDAVG